MVGFAFDTKNGKVEDDTWIFFITEKHAFHVIFLDQMIVFV